MFWFYCTWRIEKDVSHVRFNDRANHFGRWSRDSNLTVLVTKRVLERKPDIILRRARHARGPPDLGKIGGRERPFFIGRRRRPDRR